MYLKVAINKILSLSIDVNIFILVIFLFYFLFVCYLFYNINVQEQCDIIKRKHYHLWFLAILIICLY